MPQKQIGEQANADPTSGPYSSGGTEWAGAPLRGFGESQGSDSQPVEGRRLRVLRAPAKQRIQKVKEKGFQKERSSEPCREGVRMSSGAPEATSWPNCSPCGSLGELFNISEAQSLHRKMGT